MSFTGTGAEYAWLITALAGTAASTYGALEAADAQEDAAKANAANQRAQALAEQTAAEEGIRRKRLENRARISRMRARMAKSGVTTTTGTPLAVLGESASRLEMGIHDTFNEARRRFAARDNAASLGMWEGSQQSRATMIGAYSGAASGLANTWGGWSNMQYQKPKANPYQ